MVVAGLQGRCVGRRGHAACHAEGEVGEAVEVGVWQESSCFCGLSGLAWAPPPPTPSSGRLQASYLLEA